MLGTRMWTSASPPVHACRFRRGERVDHRSARVASMIDHEGSEVMDTLNRDVLKKVSATLDEIKEATANLNDKLLSEKNLKKRRGNFAN